jgi:hypothetical protein
MISLKGDKHVRKILVVTVLTVAMSIVAFSEANDWQTERSQSEQQLIALSQEFVRASIGALVVEEGGVKMTPFGPMLSLEVKEQWEAVGIKEMRVHFDGESAIVTGHVIFRGQAPEDKTRNSSGAVTIHFLKQKEQWKLVGGCYGECSE